MLLSLRIENFALVDRLELDLRSGLTVLTGETGAGKSIILDALDAALGGKVTSRVIRSGAERALVEATFEIQPDLKAWLEKQDIAAIDDGLVCSREVTASTGSQRSRSRVNGVVVNKQQMEELRDRLVEITAQGQTVQIGHPALQREWLDSFGGSPILHQRTAVAQAFAAYQQASQALESRRRAEQERLQQLDLFEYQLRELNAANLTEADELEQLEQEAKRLSHSVELQQQSYRVYQALYQSDTDTQACADLLGKAQETLQAMVEIDASLQPILELVITAFAQVEEAGRDVNAYGESIEADPQRLQEVQERTTQLKQLCRKYGPTLTEAIALRDRLQNDLIQLTGGGQSVEELAAAAQAAQAILAQACAELTHLRHSAANDLERRIVSELKPLAMEKVKFQVELKPSPTSALGSDQVTYLFSPNPGEPLQPLTEIASGGEMSRFLLALQSSFSQIDPVSTLVFDEIDVGVSGRVTQAIAEKLFHLSQHHQVLCVTHQPIVAAMADHHLRVSKHVIESSEPANGNQSTGRRKKEKSGSSKNGQSESPAPTSESPIPTPELHDDVRTVVRVTPLNQEQRKHELAQLAGGESAQKTHDSTNDAADGVAYAFAESLLAQAEKLRLAESDRPPESPLLAKADGKPRSSRSKTSRKSS